MKDKNSKNNKDVVDFIFDNYDSLKDGSNTILIYLKEMWIVVPDIVSNFFTSVFNFIEKFIMKLRSQYAIAITNDISHLENAKQLWKDLIKKKNNGTLKSYIKKKSLGKSNKQKEYLELIRYYVRKDTMDKFLSCYISQQNNKDFISIRDELLRKSDKYGTSLLSERLDNEASSDPEASSDSEDLDLTEMRERKVKALDVSENKDIFITSDNKKKKVKNHKAKDTTSDIGATDSQMSAADAYRKKFYGINK